jgi:hypothetical protein
MTCFYIYPQSGKRLPYTLQTDDWEQIASLPNRAYFCRYSPVHPHRESWYHKVLDRTQRLSQEQVPATIRAQHLLCREGP